MSKHPVCYLSWSYCLLASSSVYAHPELADLASLQTGFVHPLLGVDHLALMVAFGLFSAQLNPAGRWRGLSAFLALMALGALAAPSLMIPHAEFLVSLSVALTGFGLLIRCPLKQGPLVYAVTAFAWIHGYVHGLDAGGTGLSWSYLVGFLLATAVLIIAGWGLAAGLARFRPLVGWTCALVGITLMVAG